MTLSPSRSALRSFYIQLKGINPTLAVLISEDIIHIALFESDEDKGPVQKSVDHLREMTVGLSQELQTLREDALRGLGYS